MKNNDWQRTEELFHTALGMSPDDRALYLAQACLEDASLQTEIESLIAAFENQNGFIEQPAFSLGLQVLSGEIKEEALVGKQIGRYKLLSLLGKGGMGEVYLAQDDLLNRKVALKFLSNKLTNDAWAKRQLMKEAQSIARLDHPNICTVYGFEEQDGYNFILMPYIEGETLACLIREGLLEAEQIPGLALQIISALVSAHSHGILHRDIKPQNIMVAANGQVKVLDFGLAKLIQQKQDALGMLDSESQNSQLGLVRGTVAYMSPEQLRAEKLDFRSDIFSFGIILYEMISGSNPYSYASNADTISAILTRDPPLLTHLTAPISGLAQIAQKCLKRDREQRYQSASELLLDLDNPSKKTASRASWKYVQNFRSSMVFALLILLLIAASFLYLQPRRVRSLAILPIVIRSAGDNTQSLSKGLTEALTNKLSRLSKLRVIAPTITPNYEDEQVAQKKAGRDFNVDAAFHATLTPEEESLALEVSLVNAADGAIIWQDKYTVAPGELLSLQADLAYQVASHLQSSLSEDEKRLLFARPTESEEAFRLYLYGRSYWNDRSNRESIKRAISFFDRAIKLDPAYAKAYAGLADSYVLLSAVTFGRPLSTEEAMPQARWAAKKAIEIDDTLAEAHTSLALYLLKYEWNWQEAEREFKRAIELDPEYPPAHFWYARLLGLIGRWPESIKESEIAKELEPFAPPSLQNLGLAYYYSRQYDRSIEYCLINLEKNPNHLATLNVLGLSYLQKGMLKESIEVFQQLYAADRFYGAAPLGFAYAKAGRRNEALETLGELSKQPDSPVQEKAIIWFGLGNNREVFQLLKQACEDRFATFPPLLMDPLLDGLRADPEFVKLVECAGLTEINNRLRSAGY